MVLSSFKKGRLRINFQTMYILLSILILAAVVAAFYFNKLVNARNLVEEGWSGVDVQLKRRHDLIPNLVEMVKGYAKHEQQTLEEVVSLRNQSKGLPPSEQKQNIESGISTDLRKIFAIVEAYPDLKADKNFRSLQDALVEIEDALQYSRRYYNGAVRHYNILVQSFPSNLIAGAFKYETRNFFEIDLATERNTPDVSFD